ncbi:MAG TPA: RNB domain-containing ribonuclease [Candidatus Paceibacterota bacterium]|nr:RNB domain-containing ribonuclease [Candidatus Paceibacterota bacterium]
MKTEGGAFNPHEQRPIRRMRVTVLTDEEGRRAGERLLKVCEVGKEPVLIEVDDPQLYPAGSTIEFDWKSVTLRKNFTNNIAIYIGKVVEVISPANDDTEPSGELIDYSRPWPEEWFGKLEKSSTQEHSKNREVEALSRLEEERPVSEDKEKHKEFYPVEYSKGGFFARVGTERRYIANADELLLLPGDEIVLAPSEGQYEVVAAEVAYEGRSTVLGRLEYRDGTTTPELRFVVRAFNADGTLDKFRFSIDPVVKGMSEQQIQELVENRSYIVFDRNTMQVTGEPSPEDTMSLYEAAELSVLTNLGIEQHNKNAEMLRRGEREQVNALMRAYGVPKRAAGKAISRASAQEMEAKITHEIGIGGIEDFRNGERITLAVDARGTGIRDDAFTIGPSSRGEGWHEIGIHIADPRLLVPAGSALDRGASERSASIFIPGRKILMLPEAVTALGSLDEGVDRRAFALIFDAKLGPDGEVEIRGIRFAPTAIQVGKTFDHDEADALLDGEGESNEPYAKAWNTFGQVMDALNQRKLIRKNSERQPHALEDSDEIVATANMLFNRASAEAFTRLKRSGNPQMKRLQEMALGTYRNAVSKAGEPPVIEQSTTPRGNLYYGGQYAYLSSPLRDYSSIIGLRSIAFLAELSKREREGEELTPETAHLLAERYAVDVVGIQLSDETRALSGDDFIAAVSEEAREHLDDVLKHALAREELIRRTERAMKGMKTLDNLGAEMQKEGPINLPKGIQVEFTDRRNKPSVEDGVTWVYGYAKVSRKKNQFLHKFSPSRSDTLRLGVKFPLPEGMQFPTAPSDLVLDGRITGVDVEKGRLILDIRKGRRAPVAPTYSRRR